MSEYTVIREYPYPLPEVWHVLTDPDQVAQWTTTGQGGRPEDFAPVPGTKFRFVGKPTIGWAGVVYCEVVSVDAPWRVGSRRSPRGSRRAALGPSSSMPRGLAG